MPLLVLFLVLNNRVRSLQTKTWVQQKGLIKEHFEFHVCTSMHLPRENFNYQISGLLRNGKVPYLSLKMHVRHAFVRLNLKFKKLLYSGRRELVLAGSVFYIYKEPLILVLNFL